MADDAPIWLTQVCPWQATVWQRALASQNVSVQWQSEGDWQRVWTDNPRLWLLDVAVTAQDLAIYCEWWQGHCAHIPLGLLDSRQRQVPESQQIQAQQWGALGVLPGFDREHLTRSVAANLRQVLAWLGVGELDKARLVPVLVALPELALEAPAPVTHKQESRPNLAPPTPQPTTNSPISPVTAHPPVAKGVRRYRGVEVSPPSQEPLSPSSQPGVRYRGVEVAPTSRELVKPPSQTGVRYRGVDMPPTAPAVSPPPVEIPAVRSEALKPPPPPKPCLGGRYQILYPLGVGGFCQTLLALDMQRPGHPQCVVKQLRPSQEDAQHLAIARRLFRAEAETLEKLGQHPQIPRLLAYFEQEEQFYLVQEYIQGNLLHEKLIPGQALPEQEVVQMLWELLEILRFVHGQGVIHRDIKPTNIIRRQEDNQLVLIDFGAVKTIGQTMTAARTVAVGTQGYAPLEQCLGQPVWGSDLYALGMVAIQALTGQAPQILTVDGKTGEWQWRPGWVSAPFANILTKLVRRDWMHRYRTTGEVMEALHPLTDWLR
ncbi:serine/threonine-protein kinase [Gloeomargarita lithophora]|nr:serine/threonine-protein kinase [Gloeomargarita lithophora]